MLRSKFEYLINSYNHVVKIHIRKWFALPLMLRALPSPKFSGELGHSILPTLAYSHALVELHPYIRERSLPHIIFLEFLFNSSSKGFWNHLEHILHSDLRIVRADFRVLPNLIESILNLVNESRDSSKLHLLEVLESFSNLREMLINNFSLSSKVFILLTSVIFSFIFLPKLYFIKWG